jgi:hypothetical protein
MPVTAMLCLEIIEPRGVYDPIAVLGRPWVAEVRRCGGRLDRRFLRGPSDWSEATHSRGVRRWYVLRSGRCYEVFEHAGWRRVRRYFCRVSGPGTVEEVSPKEVAACLSAD